MGWARAVVCVDVYHEHVRPGACLDNMEGEKDCG